MKKRKIAIYCILAILFSLLFTAINLYLSCGELFSENTILYYCSNLPVLLLNLFPSLVILCLLFVLSGRLFTGTLVSGLLYYSISCIQYWKMCGRNEPLFAADIVFVKDALNVGDKYIFLDQKIVLSFVIVLIAIIISFFVDKSLNSGLVSNVIRFPLLLLIILSSIICYLTVYTSDSIFTSLPMWDGMDMWLEKNRYIATGGVYPLIYSTKEAFFSAPEGYKKDDAISILTAYKEDSIPGDKKASVIFVMFEAFSDLSNYTDLVIENDPYLDFHILELESYHGNLVTDQFGGGTVYTERYALTGFTKLTRFLKPSWSYARYFADQDYDVIGSHPGLQDFYRRITVNNYLGFDNYLFFENYYNQFSDSSWAVNDHIFLNDISDRCINYINKGHHIFSFNVTIQNHGSYPDYVALFDEEYISRDYLANEQEFYIINNYLSGIKKTGSEMMNMIGRFSDLEEPVILVFFGDHKPWLGNNGGVYNSLHIDFNLDSEASFYNYYSTEYLIWANQSAKQLFDNDFRGEGSTISPCFLMNQVFHLTGWSGPRFLKLSDEIYSITPIVNIHDRYCEDGKLISGSQLSTTAKDLLTKMDYAQYYLSEESMGIMP